jgi:hypothetical protein
MRTAHLEHPLRPRRSSLAPALLAVLGVLAVGACSPAAPTTPLVRIDSPPASAGAEEPTGNLLATITVTARPENLVVDGHLGEWLTLPDPVSPAGPPTPPLSPRPSKRPVEEPSSHVAVAVTPAGLAVAGELSASLAEGFWLALVLDVPEVPSVGYWLSNGGYSPLSCHDGMEPEERAACDKLIEDHERLVIDHPARFRGHYFISPAGVSVHRNGVLTPVDGAQVAFQRAGAEFRAEATIPPKGLPRTQQAPLSTFHAYARGAPASKPPILQPEDWSTLTLTVPVGFEPHAALRERVFAFGQLLITDKPFCLSYQPGDGLEVEDLVHETSTSLRAVKKTLYSKLATMGDVEVGAVHAGTHGRSFVPWTTLVSFHKGAFRAIAQLDGSLRGLVQRDGELHAFTWAAWQGDDPFGGSMWSVLAFGPDGAPRDQIIDSHVATSALLAPEPSHAPDFSTFAITAQPWDLKTLKPGVPSEITWTWDAAAKRYKPSLRPLKKAPKAPKK